MEKDLPEVLSQEPTEILEAIGGWGRERLSIFLDLSNLLYLTFKELIFERKKGFSLVFEIALRQIYFTGVQALKVVTLVSLTLGTIVIVESGSQMEFLGGRALPDHHPGLGDHPRNGPSAHGLHRDRAVRNGHRYGTGEHDRGP